MEGCFWREDRRNLRPGTGAVESRAVAANPVAGISGADGDVSMRYTARRVADFESRAAGRVAAGNLRTEACQHRVMCYHPSRGVSKDWFVLFTHDQLPARGQMDRAN